LRGSHVARENAKSELGIERALMAQRLLRESGLGSPLSDLTVAMDVAESYRMAGWDRQAAAAFADAFNQLVALGRGETDKAATLLNNWGVAVDSLGQPLEAEQLFRRAIAIGTAEGNEEAVSPMLLNNLGRTLIELHRFAEAAEYSERAYAKAQRVGGTNVVNLCLNVLGAAYRELGDFTRSAEVIAKLESNWQRTLPPGHSAFASLASQKSLLTFARGDARGALEEADRAIALAEAIPEGRDRLMIFLLRRTKMRMQLEQFEEARADAARAVALSEEVIGPELRSCWSGRVHLALGRALKAQGKLDEARAAYASALKHLESSLGKDNPETVEAARGVSNQ